MNTNQSMPVDSAVLLGEKCPFGIRILKYAGEDSSSKLLDDRVISGSVTQQLDSVRTRISMLSRHLPLTLLYEVIANAVIHRDYSIAGEIVVRLFTNKAQIVSLGGIPGGLSLDDIRMGISVSRNAELASILRQKGYCMLSGNGMTLLSEYYSSNGLTPAVTASQNAFFVELPFTVSRISKLKGVVKRRKKAAGSSQQSMIIDYIRKNGSIKRSTVQRLLKVGQTRALNILSSMTADGTIVQSGFGKNTVYLLTEREE